MSIRVRVHKEHEPPPWDRIVELARISLDNPVAGAVLRLHQPGDLGHCEECGRLDGNGMRDTTWPCPTVLAIEQAAARPKPIVFDPEAVKQVPAPIGPWQWEWPPVVTAEQLPGHPLVKPKEPTDGAA